MALLVKTEKAYKAAKQRTRFYFYQKKKDRIADINNRIQTARALLKKLQYEKTGIKAEQYTPQSYAEYLRHMRQISQDRGEGWEILFTDKVD